ncbi:hypothetical protein GCM10023080_011020 [Streptomyces pseudoechinosporeus]
MKSLKAAAIVAGSLFVAGLATPAVAADAAGGRPVDLNGKVRSNLTPDVVKVPGVDGQKLLDPKQDLASKAIEETTGAVDNSQLAG